jgi:hypothetical protein
MRGLQEGLCPLDHPPGGHIGAHNEQDALAERTHDHRVSDGQYRWNIKEHVVVGSFPLAQ